MVQERINRITEDIELATINYGNSLGIIDREYYTHKISRLKMELEKLIRIQQRN